VKFRVTLKDPDAFYEAIQDAVKDSITETPGISEREAEAIRELRHESTTNAISKWVEYGEYVTIEFDTGAGTATVIPK